MAGVAPGHDGGGEGLPRSGGPCPEGCGLLTHMHEPGPPGPSPLVGCKEPPWNLEAGAAPLGPRRCPPVPPRPHTLAHPPLPAPCLFALHEGPAWLPGARREAAQAATSPERGVSGGAWEGRVCVARNRHLADVLQPPSTSPHSAAAAKERTATATGTHLLVPGLHPPQRPGSAPSPRPQGAHSRRAGAGIRPALGTGRQKGRRGPGGPTSADAAGGELTEARPL